MLIWPIFQTRILDGSASHRVSSCILPVPWCTSALFSASPCEIAVIASELSKGSWQRLGESLLAPQRWLSLQAPITSDIWHPSKLPHLRTADLLATVLLMGDWRGNFTCSILTPRQLVVDMHPCGYHPRPSTLSPQYTTGRALIMYWVKCFKNGNLTYNEDKK